MGHERPGRGVKPRAPASTTTVAATGRGAQPGARQTPRSTSSVFRRATEPSEAALEPRHRAWVDAEPSSPRAIGRYSVLRRLGVGGMGEVYAAYDPDLDRRVAIKLVHSRLVDEIWQSRIVREAQALAQLSHPNVVQVY
ncbi:MAG: hypothetical protein KC468_34215, partial [Myxococcales bacterium]|nr:hypothetical protein [Myxococcales bacterium]